MCCVWGVRVFCCEGLSLHGAEPLRLARLNVNILPDLDECAPWYFNSVYDCYDSPKTPLCLAVFKNDKYMVRHLLAAGAREWNKNELLCCDIERNSTLFLSISAGHQAQK
jgi:hypothetical protein